MNDFREKRAEPRSMAGQYSSVEFTTSSSVLIYQFKVWNIAAKGMCILVKETSEAMQHLNVGDILEMKYYPVDRSGPPEMLKTEIRHITKNDEGRFQGHFFVGLLILE